MLCALRQNFDMSMFSKTLLLAGILSICPTSRAEDTNWFAFNPPPDAFTESPIDLRWLNEKFAGENGVIAARGDEFVHSANNEPVRF